MDIKLKNIFTNKDKKKIIKNKKFYFLRKTFYLYIKKKLNENKNIKMFITKFPNINEIGNKVKTIKNNLSFSLLKLNNLLIYF